MSGRAFEPKVYEMTAVVEFFADHREPEFRFMQNGRRDSQVVFDSYLNLLILHLEPTGIDRGKVELASNVQWLTEHCNVATKVPPLSVRCESPHKLTILDLNTATDPDDPQSYRFLLSVVSGGRMYTSHDPTIVNKEPPVGGQLSTKSQ